MTRIDRLKSYQKMEGPKGAGRDMANIDYWSNRAETNSELAPRASDGPMRLPSTRVSVRDTEMGPKVSRSVNARMAAKADKNDVGSTFMPNVRRTTS